MQPRSATANAAHDPIRHTQPFRKCRMIRVSWLLHQYLHKQMEVRGCGKERVLRNAAVVIAAMIAAVTAASLAAVAATAANHAVAAATSAAAPAAVTAAIAAHAAAIAAARNRNLLSKGLK